MYLAQDPQGVSASNEDLCIHHSVADGQADMHDLEREDERGTLITNAPLY